MKKLLSNSASYGAVTVIEHVCTEISVATAQTGKGPEVAANDGRQDLATRFTLCHRDDEVARCQ